MITIKRSNELDALRGIAATSVCLFHYHLFEYGNMGVDLFFLISGFVIFLSVYKSRNYLKFLIGRFSRLYPTYWTAVTFTAIIYICWLKLTNQTIPLLLLKDYLANLTMFQSLFEVKNIDGVYWTLIIELYFYAFIIGILISKTIKNIEYISFIMVIICLILPVIFDSNSSKFYAFLQQYIPIVNHFPLFASGIIFYMTKAEGLTTFRLINLTLCYITQVSLYKHSNALNNLTIFEYSIVLLIFFLLFALLILNKLNWLVNPVTLFLGKISYSLYLIHNHVFVYILIPGLTKLGYPLVTKNIAALFVALPLSIFLAWILNKYIEIPSTNSFKKKLKPR